MLGCQFLCIGYTPLRGHNLHSENWQPINLSNFVANFAFFQPNLHLKVNSYLSAAGRLHMFVNCVLDQGIKISQKPPSNVGLFFENVENGQQTDTYLLAAALAQLKNRRISFLSGQVPKLTNKSTINIWLYGFFESLISNLWIKLTSEVIWRLQWPRRP